MIISDGHRSMKREWFAKKQIKAIRDIDVPAKTVVLDGFKISVWQQGDLEGGRITAPMGAVVALSSPEGIKIAAMENWLGGCTSYGDHHILYVNAATTVVLEGNATEEDLLGEGFAVMKAKPDLMGAYFDVDGTDTLVQQYSCTPAITPYLAAEAYVVTTTDKQFVDLDNSGVADLPYDHLESVLTGYNSNNSNMAGRKTTILANGPNNIWKTCANLPGNQRVSWTEYHYDHVGYEPSTDEGDWVCAQHQKENNVVNVLLKDVVPDDTDPLVDGMPVGLRDLMLNVGQSIVRPLGSYSFVNADGKMVFITAAHFSDAAVAIDGTVGSDSLIADWFSDNDGSGGGADETDWRIFVAVLIRDTTTTPPTDIATAYNMSGFYSLLEAKATMDFTQQSRISDMLSYFFPYPNTPGLQSTYWAWKPHDSVMFHGPGDSAYTWTRAAGAVEINPSGVTEVTILVPSEVTATEGCRPDIQYCGGDLYFCACNKVKENILAMYIGSPFTDAVDPGWDKVPDPVEGVLVNVRPVVVTLEELFLIGIVKVEVEQEDGSFVDAYRFAMFRGSGAVPEDPELSGIEWTGEWKLLALLPFDAGDSDNFAVCLYGKNPMVTALLEHPAPPPAVPQNIVGPYSSYGDRQP